VKSYKVVVSFTGWYVDVIKADSLEEAAEKAGEMLDMGELDDSDREYFSQDMSVEEVL
jgi:hypothetical protein